MDLHSRTDRAVPLILLLALALRLFALDFGLPLAEARPDELTIAYQAMKFGTFDFNPHSFNYPSLFKYLMFGVFGAYYAVGRAIGHFSGQEDFLREFFNGAVNFRLLMRLVSAGMGTLGVGLLLRSPGPVGTGPAAAMALALCFLHVRDSHFGVTDITMVTLATATVLLALQLHEKKTPRSAILAGLMAGLCTSTKYNGALLALPLLIAGGNVSLVGTAAVAMIGGFLLGTPYAILDITTFLKDFSYEAKHLTEGHFVDVGGGWANHLTRSLRYGMGIPAIVAGLWGWFLLFRHNRHQALIVVSFPITYYLFIGRGETAFFRYILPVVPFLCIGIGVTCARTPRPVSMATLISLPSLAASLLALNIMAHGDTRDAMGKWIEENIPNEATLVHAGAYTGAPMLQRNVTNQTREYMAKAGRADVAGFRKPDDPRWYDRSRPAYDVLFVKKAGIEFASQLDVEKILAEPPEWLLVEDYFLIHYSAVPEEIKTLASTYEMVHEERAWEGDVAPVFDQQDAFYLPVWGFSGFTRMGPTLKLYHRRAPEALLEHP